MLEHGGETYSMVRQNVFLEDNEYPCYKLSLGRKWQTVDWALKIGVLTLRVKNIYTSGDSIGLG